MPLPMVVNDVITKLFNFTAAEYPAITGAPNPLITLWIKIFPMEIKLCCKILGMAMIKIFLKSSMSNSAGFSGHGIVRSLNHTVNTAMPQLIP